ncbi:carbon storage regulator CsrA [Virgibacillus chiguensis]|uniref:Translational regulator CsrA n=1 Tax=Virgibacillus chiguensis TaxID=411959 RepID=A0A1M5SF61_9BACI|nr:carbon storage regulator CsrA [Virgibacillus chiguensis]SHH37109.1 carbon storage regulator [Virgibacillus chiguensis]
MLVLTRKRNEAIQIGEDIEIKVLGMEGDQVKIGISAPTSVDIYRKELYLDITHENNKAANISNEIVNLLKDNT